MLQCTTIENLSKDRIHCVCCSRDYAIYSLKHICNPVLPCNAPKKTCYEERYLPDIKDTESDIICEKCEFATILLKQPRLCKCPKCEYEGRYVHDETKLCPACKVVGLDTPKRVPTVKAAETVHIEQIDVPKVHITLYPVLTKGAPGEFGCLEEIKIRAMSPDELLSDEWFINNNFEYNIGHKSHGHGDNYEDCCANATRELANYIARLNKTHYIKWNFAYSNPFDREWLQRLYHKYGPKDAPCTF